MPQTLYFRGIEGMRIYDFYLLLNVIGIVKRDATGFPSFSPGIHCPLVPCTTRMASESNGSPHERITFVSDTSPSVLIVNCTMTRAGFSRAGASAGYFTFSLQYCLRAAEPPLNSAILEGAR